LVKLFGFRLFERPRDPKVFEFRCGECGELHRGSPSFSYAEPPHSFAVPEAERATRIQLTSDTCVIDNDTFFIRGLLEIPIDGADEPFAWGIWVSQSRESFDRYVETFDQDQSGDGSFGWLTVTMPGYVDPDAKPVDLACNVQWRGNRVRPRVVPQECDHPLYHDCANGISWDRAIDLAQHVMHKMET